MINSIGRNVLSFKSKSPEVSQKLDREHTVAILGASKETPYNKRFIQMANTMAYDLANRGYNIITGGGYGTMEAANKGAWAADPSKSFAVEVKGWIDKHKPKIFNNFATVNTFAERTELFRNIAKYWVIFPGGPGTMEELSIGGESKYYNAKPAPEMILVGKKFQKPLFNYLRNMNNLGVAKHAEKSYQLADNKQEIVDKIIGSSLDVVA